MARKLKRNTYSALTYKKFYFSGISSGLFLSFFIIFHGPSVRDYYHTIISSTFRSQSQELPITASQEDLIQSLKSEITSLKKRYSSLTPRTSYLVISTTDNLIYLHDKGKIIHHGPCSSGSYVHLKASNNREWLFKTPRGSFKVNMKLKAPVWYMPDWAFLEEGRKIPPAGSRERYDSGALGDYALSIGRGYLIHGTIYKRLIGKPVTHGCIRLDDEELNMVYRHLKYGARVFIY